MTADPFLFEDDPAAPGWKRWQFRESGRYNAFLEPIHVRIEDGIARVRMTPGREHANMREAVHGGALLGFMDVALFAATRGLGVLTGGAVTLDLSAQFIGAGRIGEALEARVELLRETGRLLFLRGLVVQEREPVVASFTGTVRKMER
ncbi:MAG: PaaI family thioesterase [Janthinobacterium lividum]